MLIRDFFKLDFDIKNATTILMFLRYSSQIFLSLILTMISLANRLSFCLGTKWLWFPFPLQKYYGFYNTHYRFI